MGVNTLLHWVRSARVAERAAAATALANSYAADDLSFEDRCAAETALTLLLDDPSPKVRLAMAEAFSMARRAPIQVVTGLASDQPDVAAPILARSSLLVEQDLIEIAMQGDERVQALIATRGTVGMALAAALAEIGGREVCLALLVNSGASIAGLSFRRLAERFGDEPALRNALLSDARLPSDCRHMLMVKLGEALSRSPLVRACIGGERAEKVAREACGQATLSLVEATPHAEHAALVAHLRLRGELTASLLIKVMADGKVDFFAAAIAGLTGKALTRVSATLASGSDAAVRSVLAASGLREVLHAPLLRALKIWRRVVRGERVAGVQEVTWAMLEEAGGEAATGELPRLLRAIHIAALRDNARLRSVFAHAA